jgi:hypothetical protein
MELYLCKEDIITTGQEEISKNGEFEEDLPNPQTGPNKFSSPLHAIHVPSQALQAIPQLLTSQLASSSQEITKGHTGAAHAHHLVIYGSSTRPGTIMEDRIGTGEGRDCMASIGLEEVDIWDGFGDDKLHPRLPLSLAPLLMSRSHQVMMPNCIPSELQIGDPVRMVGRFNSYHPSRADTFVLEYKGATVLIDTGSLDPMRFEEISQMEVYGDMTTITIDGGGDGKAEYLLYAKILRVINDADLNIYERVIPLLAEKRSKSKLLSC